MVQVVRMVGTAGCHSYQCSAAKRRYISLEAQELQAPVRELVVMVAVARGAAEVAEVAAE